MVEYSKVNVKLRDTQLKKLKTAVKNNAGTNLRMSLKIFDGKDLPRELFLTARLKFLKIIQSAGFLGSLLRKLADRLMKVAAPLAKNILALLGITASAMMQEFKRKITVLG